MYVVYKATNIVNNKNYIGETGQGLEKRRRLHIYEAYSRNSSKYFYSAIRKYGKESFSWEIIDTAETLEEINKKEIYWIAFYNSNDPKFGYNMTAGGGGMNGYSVSEETKRKMSDAKKGKKCTEEHKNNLRRAKIGSQHSEKTKDKMRVSHTGVKHTEEAKTKMRVASLGIKKSETAKENMSKARKGVLLSEEHKINMRGNCNARRCRVVCLDNGQVFDTIREAAKSIGKTGSAISNACNGKTKTSGGLHWEYLQD